MLGFVTPTISELQITVLEALLGQGIWQRHSTQFLPKHDTNVHIVYDDLLIPLTWSLRDIVESQRLKNNEQH